MIGEIMKYLGLSRQKLINIINNNNINFKNTALIIFLDSDLDTASNTYIQKFLKLIKNYNSLILTIDDIPKKYPNLIPPTKKTAIQIKTFIDHLQNQNLIISCTAGISRTGAVIHYLDVLNNNDTNWQKIHSREDNLTYYKNDQYLPNTVLDRNLQKLLKNKRKES